MPLYDYECPGCRPFRAWGSMADYDKPMACPDCGKAAQRSVASPLLGMDAGRRKANAINEKSANEPRVVRRKRGDPMASHDAHRDLTGARQRQRCGHDHHAGEGKLHRSRHPWAIRH